MITILSPRFREDLARVYGTLQWQPLSAAFLSDLVQVHATLPAMCDANFRYLAEQFHQWRTLTKDFVRDRLLHLTDDDPLRCPISLFRTMDYGRLETAHTRTLAWLLDPGNDAEHGFGHTLINALLKRVADRDDLEGIQVDRVLSEHSFGDSVRKGRLDILAEGEWQCKEQHVQWVLVIEAKVDAWEGEGQLLKYDEWLRSYAGDREIYRVFLTPDRRTPDSNADEWQSMSFLELVRIFRSIYGDLRQAQGFHYLRFYLAGVLQDICDVPRNIGENVEDPYSIASYLRSVHDPDGVLKQ